eukprot:6479948-Amphidinium_carterae.2
MDFSFCATVFNHYGGVWKQKAGSQVAPFQSLAVSPFMVNGLEVNHSVLMNIPESSSTSCLLKFAIEQYY